MKNWFRHILLVGLWVALPLFGHGAIKRPNVIFILMDDMGYSDVSCY